MLRSKYQGSRFSESPVVKKKQNNPITLVVLGYLLLIVVGAILLSLPVQQYDLNTLPRRFENNWQQAPNRVK